MKNADQFKAELTQLINRHSMENGANIPDFLIANYLVECLRNLNFLVNENNTWNGFKKNR